MVRLIVAFLLAAVVIVTPAAEAPTQQPRAVADELLAADVAASSASARTTVIPGLTAMFAADVMMQAPGVGFARGIPAATEALTANPDNATAKVDWTPVRAGISGDGLQGFTFGYMTLHRADGTCWSLRSWKRRAAATQISRN